MKTNRHSAFMLGLVTATALAFGNLAPAQAQETQDSVRIGTSPVGSVGYIIAVGVSQLLQEHEGMTSTVEPVGGSVASVFSIGAGQIDAAMTNAIAALDGYEGGGEFPGPIDIRLLAVGQSSFRQLVVRTGSGIETPADLAGATIVGIRPALPELEQITHALLEEYDVDPDSVRIVATTATNEAVDLLNTGAVDAAIIPGGANASYLQQLASDGRIEFLAIPQDRAEAMLERLHPALRIATLPAGIYPGQDEDIPVFDVPVYLVASAAMSDETAYRMMSAIFDNYEQFSAFHATADEWRLETTLPNIPFHPGAIQYMQQSGEWSDVLQQAQDALLSESEG